MVMATLFWIGLLSVLSLGVGFTRHSDGSIEANEFRVSKIDGEGVEVAELCNVYSKIPFFHEDRIRGWSTINVYQRNCSQM